MCITLGGFGTQKVRNSIDGKIYLKKGKKMVKCKNIECKDFASITDSKKYYCASCYLLKRGWTTPFTNAKIKANYI
jgi:hypothetical protein